jgi:hypothetical protein
MNIKFDKKFYNLTAIKKSVERYKGFANFKIKEKDDFIEIDIINPKKEFKAIIKDELSNYILSEIKDEN